MKYKILHHTLMDGWVDWEHDENNETVLHDTREEAQAEIQECIDDMEGYDEEQFEIVEVDEEPIPICWKCNERITEELPNAAHAFIGCKRNDKIKCWDDAKKLCPVLNELSAHKAKIDSWVKHLRDEHRIKRNVDYAFTVKYGQIHVIAEYVYMDIVQMHASQLLLDVRYWTAYERKQGKNDKSK